MRIPIASWKILDWQGPASNVKFRIFANNNFVARENDDSGIEIDAAPNFYREVDCVVATETIDGLSVKTITIPALWLYSTNDALLPNRQSTYRAAFVSRRGGSIQNLELLQAFQLPKELLSVFNPVPWHEILRANYPAAPWPMDKDTYSTSQILELIANAGGPDIGANAAVNRVAYFTSPTDIDGAVGLVFDPATNRLTVGVSSSAKGSVRFANQNNALIQSWESADTPASTIRFQLPAADPSVGNSLRVASFGGGVAVLEWSNPPGGGGGGSGDVVGPGSATDEALARFDLATGKIIQNSLVTLNDLGAFSFPDNVRQTFNPGATVAGLNVGSHIVDPASPLNGDLWYESTNNQLRARINGSTVALGAGGGGSGDVVGPGTATDNAVARFDNTTGKLIQNSVVIISDTGDITGIASLNTHTLPAGTSVIATIAAAQTFTNKTLTASNNVLGGVTMTLGSDGTGDTYYRSAGNVLTRLAIGSTNFVLSVAGGIPAWRTAPATFGDVVGPGASTDNAIARFDSTTGKVIQNSAVTVADTTGAFQVPNNWTLNDANGNEVIAISPVASAINEFTFGNASAGNPITMAATGGDTNISIQTIPKGTGVFESTGPLVLSGTGLVNFTTPIAATIPTKINIPLFTPPGFSQILALGLASAAPGTARVITVCDQRTAGHQPSIAVLSPDENNIFGLTWDGQNTGGFISSTTNIVGMLGTDAFFGNGVVNGAPAAMVLNGTGGSGTNIGGADLYIAPGKGTGNAAAGLVALRYPLTLGSGTTLQSLSSAAFPVSTNMFIRNDGDISFNNSTAETSILGAAQAGSTKVIEAGLSRVGRVFLIRLWGSVTSTGTPTLTLRLKLNGTTVADIGAVTLNAVNAVNGGLYVEALVTVRAVGTSGVFHVFPFKFNWQSSSGGAMSQASVATAPTVNTTIAQTIDITAQWSAASASNSITIAQALIDILR